MSSQEGSEATSNDSEVYGEVARAGFTRMYVLLHSALSPLDQDLDYRSERVKNEEEDGEDAKETRGEDGRRRKYEDLEAAYDDEDAGGGVERFQLMYANGRHYFHGTIPLPDGLLDDEKEEDMSREEEEEDADGSGSDESPRMKESRRRPHRRRHGRRGDPAASIDVEDLPLLLPHFQEHQDELTVIEDVTHFRQELRDVVYQMEEVGEFMVEELSKDKVIQRIDEGSREFHWMVSPQNPTFFELQTYRRTSEAFVDAGVVLVVMKMVVRGVLLDVIYHKDSYFITLRENDEELALEDMFIPNLSCVGPCYIVRRYSDADLKQLLLWCAFPSSSSISVEGKSASSHPSAELSLHIPAQTPSNTLKVAPMCSKASPAAILEANDTQLYCVLPSSRRRHARKYQKATATRKPKREANVEEDVDDSEQEVNVVFQFNQYLYNGKATVVPSEMNDLNKLSQVVLPDLKAQALTSLSFFGSLGDEADPTELPTPILWTMHVKKRFEQVAVTLMDLLTQSQVWVEKFLSEIDSVAKESAQSDDGVDWLGSHLRGWLDNAKGTEYFYELELTVVPQFLWGERQYEELEELKSSDVDLMLWKGVVNQVIVVVIYRRGSFYMILREIEDVSSMPRDGLEFFGLLPELAGKGRGYLIRNFPGQIKGSYPQWLSGAKLLLWQTVASIAREDVAAEEAQAKWQQSQTKQDDDKATAAWFEEKGDEKLAANGDDSAVRRAERVQREARDDHKHDQDESSHSSPIRQREKVSKRHHLAPMNGAHNPRGTLASAPWDIRSGRPV